jgi:hypothetical protein
MRYFHRVHVTPEQVLAFAQRFFGDRAMTGGAGGAAASWSDARGAITVEVEGEGGHYTRVTAGTSDVGESELDKVAKRFLAELHAHEAPGHPVRGAY